MTVASFKIAFGGKYAVWRPEGETVEADFWCGNGYRVRITLGWDDTWTVQRPK